MSTWEKVKMVFARTGRAVLWISLDVKRSQWKALRKTKRAARRSVPLGATLNERLSTGKCSLPSLAIFLLNLMISTPCKIFKKFCHYCLKKIAVLW